MTKKEQTRERLNKIRGEILSETIEIESSLTLRLLRFFYPKQNSKKTAFYWSILNTGKFGFGDKIKLFERIPYFKKLKKYDSISESLRFVQSLRNKLAHWDLVENQSSLNRIILRGSITVKDVIIDDKLLKEFKDREEFLLSNLR